MFEESNKNIIEEYFQYYTENISQSKDTLVTARNVLKQFVEVYGDKPLESIERADVLRYTRFLSTYQYIPKSSKDNEPRNYKPQTIFARKSVVRQLLKWLYEAKDETEDRKLYNVTNLTGLIKLKRVPKDSLPKNMLSFSDVEKLMEACSNVRDEAMLAFLLDSGVRRGELLDIKYGDVHIEGNKVIVMVPKKKTIPRRVFCVWCFPAMYRWLEKHPLKTQDSYLFCSLRKPHNKFSKTGLWEALKAIAEKSGLEKHVYCHLFRSSSATIYAGIEGITDQILKKRYGWTPASAMANVYIHMSGKESDDPISKAFGLPVSEKLVGDQLMVICPTCRLNNLASADTCFNCFTPLSKKEIEKVARLKAAEEARKAVELEEKIRAEVIEKMESNAKKVMEDSFGDLQRMIDELQKQTVEVIDSTQKRKFRKVKKNTDEQDSVF
jgi:site-specific recombinase XerD